MSKKDARREILQAVDRVLARHGLNALTIDKVAAEAGMSKGGVIHYFATKQDLVMANLVSYHNRFFERREAYLATLPDTPERLARATIHTMIDTWKAEPGAAWYRIDMLEDPQYREQIGTTKRRIFQDVLKGARDPSMILTAMFYIDGLWLNSMYRPSPAPPQSVEESYQKLLLVIESLWAHYR
ncbi:MAG: TetR/AcrR family transcriptional regulator [Planctomycetaceae bacterium]|nr:TetR/AcrR family transcriptional regulator [Planctomycetaceae bacterium]